jgi:hypothetical protein
MEKVVPLDTKILPEAAVSGAVALATESETMLSFNASDGSQYGCAIVRFKHCNIHKFGYPNDEASSGIPRTRGLSYGCYEVLNGTWLGELRTLNEHSFPGSPYGPRSARHFLFLFHDSSFECLADDLTIEIVPFEQFPRIALDFLGAEAYRPE